MLAKSSRARLRTAMVFVLAALAYVSVLSYDKAASLRRFSQENLETLKSKHPKVVGLFQASFYFFYEEQFLPGIRGYISPSGKDQFRVQQIVILSNQGSVLFDSQNPKRSEATPTYADPEVLGRLSSPEPSVLIRGFKVHYLMPAGQYEILYILDAQAIQLRLFLALGVGLLLGVLVWRFFSTHLVFRFWIKSRRLWVRFWKLRVKFLATIVLINLVTAAIVFYTLSSMQTREQTERIEKDSVLFSQFSIGRVISDFTNFYYFYYGERFLPEIKNTIASNENLLAIRIISRRNHQILFDSEEDASTPVASVSEARKVSFTEAVEEQLKNRDIATRSLERGGEKLLSVIVTYRNENQPLFWVEYLFSFQTLSKSLQAIRKQILIDLIPSLGLSLLIAMVFAQLLISPIRRLVAALQSVTSGDFNASVEVTRTDEIGELSLAFNAMTSELKKKKELRKYLSESTYRQVMRAVDGEEGLVIGGSRLVATVLFADIRDFVGFCETMDAEEVTAMLNEYFSEMVEVVYKHGGEVDKFIGDAFLAVFYGQEQEHAQASSGTALQAIYCALEMRERLAEFNTRRQAIHQRSIEIGVGITHGEIISGPIGSKDRMDFTVIGDVVNLASRIEKLSKNGQHTKIVFSHHVEERIRGLLDYAELSREQVRGKQEEVVVFELVGIRQIDTLIRNLKGIDPTLRRRSIELLGQSRNPAALPPLLESMRDEDEMCRILSVLSIAKLAPKDDPEAIQALLRAIKHEKSERIIPSLISAFSKICTTDQVFELVPFLNSPHERIVANTIEALGQSRSSRATDLILPKLYSRNNRIKANAALALFGAGHIEVIDTLKPMLMHSDPLMRSSAAFAIGELTMIAEYSTLIRTWNSGEKGNQQAVKVFLAELQECVPMLVALLKDRDMSVRRQAVIALGKIKDKSAVLPLIDLVDIESNTRELRRDIQEALRSIGSHRAVREVISRLT